jgi:type IV fimbrial biogenesis protein FimT
MLASTVMKRAQGFTLIELMIGIAVLAIVLALGMPSYNAWIQNTRLRNTAESILAGLQLARSEAVSRNQSVRFVFDETDGDWVVGCVTASTTCPAGIQKKMRGEGSSSSITVVASDDHTIIFDSLGRMTSPVPGGGASFASFEVDILPAVLAADKTRDLRITIDIGGGVRLCDPNVTALDARACP